MDETFHHPQIWLGFLGKECDSRNVPGMNRKDPLLLYVTALHTKEMGIQRNLIVERWQSMMDQVT